MGSFWAAKTRATGFSSIPGTKRLQRLDENIAALDIELTPDEVTELDALTPPPGNVGVM